MKQRKEGMEGGMEGRRRTNGVERRACLEGYGRYWKREIGGRYAHISFHI